MPCCEIHPSVMTPEEEEREVVGDPLDWLPPGELQRLSEVASFYEGASVFLTGATGFIGTLILEKLLRSCHGVSTIYVLIRDKKGVPLRERLRSHLEQLIFSKAREACPDYARKVVPIAGDCTQPGLGIGPADAAELTCKVSVVFHVAATVRFDADLRTAAVTNVRSTCEAVNLVKRLPNLKAFVYMSTAYSNAPRDEIDETFHPPGLKAEELLKLIRVMDDEQLAQLLPLMLGDWPNTYTFTKAVAEDVILEAADSLPVSIIRPSIVSSTYREPVSLWVGNMYGPSAMGAGAAVGLLHITHINPAAIGDGVPADLIANATIVCAWDTWRRHSMKTMSQPESDQPMIYNCISSARHPLSWGMLRRCVDYARKYPSMKTIWYGYGFMVRQKWLYVIGAVLFHLIPAIIADTFLRVKGMEPILWNLYARIHGVSQALEPFTTREWTFKDDNLVSMIGRLGPADLKLFPCDVTEVDYEWLFSNNMRGLRFYVLKESYDNLEAARKKYRWLTVAHFVVVGIGTALLIFLLWRILAARIGL